MLEFTDLTQKVSENIFICISVPITGALIGWITNYIAVKMIFRPRKQISILGIKIQGLVPKRQSALAQSIGETIERDLLSHQDIEKVLQSKDIESDVSDLVSKQVDIFLQGFIEKNPMVKMFLQGPLLEQIREALVSQMKMAVPDVLDGVMRKVEEKLNFKEIVQQKIEGFDLSKLESIIYRISATELKTIELLGGILGFMVGVMQVAIMLASK